MTRSTRNERVRHAVIVGASAGIGKLLLEALGASGVTPSTIGRARPSGFSGWHRVCADLTTLDWAGAYADAEHGTGESIDAVVYVAGDATFGRTGAIPDDRARRVFESNFWAPANAAVAAEKLWAAPRRGTFVSVSTISARRAVPFEAHYGSSKAACARFLDAYDLEFPDGRLRFLSVYPGRLRTAFRAKADWHGLAVDLAPTSGGDPATVVRAIVAMLDRREGAPVLGLRERAIDLADRLSPTLYDRLVLRRRVHKVLKKQGRP